MVKEIPGGCIEVWRKEPLEKASKDVLALYAGFLNKVTVSFTIRFMPPQIWSKKEEPQILKAIGFIPMEEIVICGFSDVIFDSAYEIMMKFGGYLRVGVTKQMIPTTKGKGYQVTFHKRCGKSKITYCYHILDGEFVMNYFSVGRDPALRQLISLDYFLAKSQ
jgi:hypothetical protein